MKTPPGAAPAASTSPVLRIGGRVSKSVLWLAGFGAAIATIVGWTQLAVVAANPHAAAYASLTRLGVGVTVNHFIAVLGEPAAVTHIGAIDGIGGDAVFTDLDRQVFLQKDFIVSILSDERQEVQQYTVLSCDPTFEPTFRTPTGSMVQLNSPALSEADTSAAKPEIVYVATGGTASTPVQLLDVMRATGDAPTRYRGYGLGISELCAAFGSVPEFAGDLSGLSPAAEHLRNSEPANYYVEIGMSYTLLRGGVPFVLPAQESIPTGYLEETFKG